MFADEVLSRKSWPRTKLPEIVTVAPTRVGVVEKTWTFGSTVRGVTLLPAKFSMYGATVVVGKDDTIGAECAGATITRNLRTIVSVPPLVVPPSSLSVTVIVAMPVALATGVKKSAPVVLALE